jgi:hypothetical protein
VVVNAAGQLDAELNLQVDTSGRQQAWTSVGAEGLQAVYPPGQAWGFFGAVLRGPTALGSRLGRDMREFSRLELDMRGAAGGEVVFIGLKDRSDPDDGSEVKKTETLTSSWVTYRYSLTDFRTADLSSVFMFFEVVFEGSSGRTIFVRNVHYVR